MKKSLFLLSVFVLSSVGLHAQDVITKTDTVIVFANKRNVVKNKKDIPGRGFSKAMEVSAGVLPSKLFNVSAIMVNGYRFNKYIFLGGGIGLEYRHDAWGLNDEYVHHYVGIPVFFRAKFNYTKTRVSPFFAVDLGVSLLWDNDDYEYIDPYFLLRPHIGLDINVSDKIKPYIMVGGSVSGGALFFGVGCKF
ncbi:MAG: hypothetical protein NC324_02770 [Bacteroides sp.]|nr:hypothetical protein [Bacteroides sp.]